MTDTPAGRSMTATEYLAWEREQLDKHEFHHGEVIQRSVCSLRHCFLAASISSELHHAIREDGCAVLSSNMRIGTPDRQHYVYPDAVVVCGRAQTEPGTNDVLISPAVVVEILSPSSETYKRGTKWAAYQLIPSLTDYLLVSQDQPYIEHYAREAEGWRYLVYRSGDSITLVNQLTTRAQLAVDAVYERAFDLHAG